jgi:ABC-type multidrug transport system ATPase subunit
MHDPGLLLLDEPTDGLDVQGRLDVLQLIQSLAAERRAVVLSSHIMGEVERVCQRACIIHRGLKIAEGSLDELRSLGGAEALDDAFVALLNAEPAP